MIIGTRRPCDVHRDVLHQLRVMAAPRQYDFAFLDAALWDQALRKLLRSVGGGMGAQAWLRPPYRRPARPETQAWCLPHRPERSAGSRPER